MASSSSQVSLLAFGLFFILVIWLLLAFWLFSSLPNQAMSIIAGSHCTQRMEEHLVLLMDELKLEATIATRIGLQQTSASASNKITDFASLTMDKIESNPKILALCRICHDEDDDSNMETPCSCRGSLKFAHRKCVQRWCNAKGDVICEICRQQFKAGYKAPPPRFYYNGVGTHFRGNFEIPGVDMESNRLFSDDDVEFSPHSSTSFLCCQVVAIIFTGLIILRHTLSILIYGSGDFSPTMFTIMAARTIGILVPMYVVFKALRAVKRLRHQCDIRDSSMVSSDEENEMPRWIHVL